MQTKPAPWYRQFWAWFVIIPPLVAVVAGTATVLIANRYADNLVTGDFSKVGLSYQSTSAAQARAEQLNIAARIEVPAAAGTVRIWLDGAHDTPRRLHLTLAHATQGQHDQHIGLVRVDGDRYEGRLPQALSGRHYIVLSDPQEDWRIEARLGANVGEARLGAGANRP